MSESGTIGQKEIELIRSYAADKGMTVEEMIRSIVERIENDLDIQEYLEAKKEFDEDPTTYTLEETKKMLGLR